MFDKCRDCGVTDRPTWPSTREGFKPVCGDCLSKHHRRLHATHEETKRLRKKQLEKYRTVWLDKFQLLSFIENLEEEFEEMDNTDHIRIQIAKHQQEITTEIFEGDE